MHPMRRSICLTVVILSLSGCGNDESPLDPSDGSDDENSSTDGSDSDVPIDYCAAPVTTTDDDGNLVVVAEDALNYAFSSSLEIQTVKVRSMSDIVFDWSDMTRDMLIHDFDPEKSVDMMEVMLWRYDKEDLLLDINDDSLDTSNLFRLGVVYTEQSMTSGNYLDLRSPSGGEVDDAELLSYVDPSEYDIQDHTYFVMVAEGESFGHGTKMISFFEPSPDVDNAEVRLTNDSTILHYEADLSSLKRIAVPPAEPNIIVDWIDTDKLTKNAMGREWIPTKITDVMVAHYADKRPSDLQAHFLDLELIADETWDIFLAAGQSVNMSFLKNADGETFPGIDENGTWIVALKCGSCNNPAPWFLSILQAC